MFEKKNHQRPNDVFQFYQFQQPFLSILRIHSILLFLFHFFYSNRNLQLEFYSREVIIIIQYCISSWSVSSTQRWIGIMVAVCVCGERQMGKKLIFWKLLVRTTCSHHFRRMTWKFSFKFSFIFFPSHCQLWQRIVCRLHTVNRIHINPSATKPNADIHAFSTQSINVMKMWFSLRSVPENRELRLFFLQSGQSTPERKRLYRFFLVLLMMT